MLREPHENVATVLVDPCVLADLELRLMALDLRLWPVATSPVHVDGERVAFQLRRRLVTAHRGEWDVAAAWVPVWISFGETWRNDDEPLSWTAHRVLWRALDEIGDHVRFHRRLGGVRKLPVPAGVGD